MAADMPSMMTSQSKVNDSKIRLFDSITNLITLVTPAIKAACDDALKRNK